MCCGPARCIPDLVARLAAEAAEVGQHVLTMCIRALDYAPPVDITFGEFLRAMITADTDPCRTTTGTIASRSSRHSGGAACIRATCARFSPDSLLWRTPDTDEIRPSKALQDALQRLQPFASEFLFAQSEGTTEPRERIFHLQRQLRRDLHAWLEAHLATHPDGPGDAGFSDSIRIAGSKCTAPASRCGPAPMAASTRRC